MSNETNVYIRLRYPDPQTHPSEFVSAVPDIVIDGAAEWTTEHFKTTPERRTRLIYYLSGGFHSEYSNSRRQKLLDNMLILLEKYHNDH